MDIFAYSYVRFSHGAESWLRNVRPWNTIPFYPEEGTEEWSCGWWAFRTTRDVAAGEELLYDHSFWGYDMAYVDGTHAPGAVPSPFKPPRGPARA